MDALRRGCPNPGLEGRDWKTCRTPALKAWTWTPLVYSLIFKRKDHDSSKLPTRRLGADTARLWRRGPEAAAPGQRSAGWRVPWRGSSDNPGTLWSLCRSADTRPTAGEELYLGLEMTPEEIGGHVLNEILFSAKSYRWMDFHISFF